MSNNFQDTISILIGTKTSATTILSEIQSFFPPNPPSVNSRVSEINEFFICGFDSFIATWLCVHIFWLAFYLTSFGPYVFMSLCLSVSLSFCLFVCLSVCLFVYLSACLFVCLSSVCLWACLCLMGSKALVSRMQIPNE